MIPLSQKMTERFLTAIATGDGRDVMAMFMAEPSIEDPMAGSIASGAAAERFVREREEWLTSRHAAIDFVRSTHIPDRTIVEYIVHLNVNGERYPLPYAVVSDHPGEDSITQIRTYHSMWPLIGKHRIRDAILPARHDLELRDVIRSYQQALAAGNVEAIVATFETNGYFREPAGGPHVHRGKEELTAFMTTILGPGGIVLEHCTVTDDGAACAIEFNAVRFGTEALVPQAGVAVYERGMSGLLHAARVYDDVNVEALAGSSG